MKSCHACNQEITLVTKIGRRDMCPHCRAELHCCLNCAFHDPTASKQCREPIAEAVKEKQKANFCDYFTFAESRPQKSQQEIQKSRRALEDLFRR